MTDTSDDPLSLLTGTLTGRALDKGGDLLFGKDDKKKRDRPDDEGRRRRKQRDRSLLTQGFSSPPTNPLGINNQGF